MTPKPNREVKPESRHESVDHINPTDLGLMEAGPPDEVPGTGIFGDETLVHDENPKGPPGIYPAPPAHTGGLAVPGPTAETTERDLQPAGDSTPKPPAK